MEGEGRKEEENYFKEWLLKISPNFCHKTTDQENSWSVKTNKWQKVMNTEVFIFKYRKWEMKEILRAAKSNFSSEINKMTNLVWNINSVSGRNYQPNVYVTKISFIFKLWDATQIFRTSLSWGHSDLYCIVMISGYMLKKLAPKLSFKCEGWINNDRILFLFTNHSGKKWERITREAKNETQIYRRRELDK